LDVCVDAGVCAGAGDATGVGAVAAGDASDGPEPGHRDELGRSAVPGDVELWAPRTVLGFSHDLAFKYGQIHVVCGSASIVSLGDADGRRFIDKGGPSEIVLRLVESRTGCARSSCNWKLQNHVIDLQPRLLGQKSI
jgi:hypothetical protein